MHRLRQLATALQVRMVISGVAALLLAFAPRAGTAQQVSQFTSNTVFGDSYADITLLGMAPNCPAEYPDCRFSNGTNFVDALNATFHLQGNNYAFGGAQTGTGNLFQAGAPGFTQQVNAFVSAGGKFGPRDLLTLSIGGNDQSSLQITDTPAQVQAEAMASANTAVNNLQRLINAGARNIIWNAPGNSTFMPNGFSPGITDAQYTLWTQTFFQQTQQLLAPQARAGVRIFLFDFAWLQTSVAADPGRYGFVDTGECFYLFDLASAPACVAQSTAVQDSHFYWDGIHLTTPGYDLLASYMTNQVNAPLTVAPQGQLVLAAAETFTDGIFGRLTAERGSARLSVQEDTTADQSQTEQKWIIFGNASHNFGAGSAQDFSSAYNNDANGGYIGLEHIVNPQIHVGFQFGYTRPRANLAVQDARYSANSYQFAGYASYTGPAWFADGILGYGHQTLSLERQGVISEIQGDTHADNLTAAGRGGYLTNVAGPILVGPIAALTLTMADIAQYTESGDYLITNHVAGQNLRSVNGEAGFEILTPIKTSIGAMSPYLDVTAVHEWGQPDRTIVTTQTSTPLLPVITTAGIPNSTYGKVATGLAVSLSPRVTATIDAVDTFPGRDSENFSVNAGLAAAF